MIGFYFTFKKITTYIGRL